MRPVVRSSSSKILTMYLVEEELRGLMEIIAAGLPGATVIEFMPRLFRRYGREHSVKGTGARFTYGCSDADEFRRAVAPVRAAPRRPLHRHDRALPALTWRRSSGCRRRTHRLSPHPRHACASPATGRRGSMRPGRLLACAVSSCSPSTTPLLGPMTLAAETGGPVRGRGAHQCGSTVNGATGPGWTGGARARLRRRARE